MSHWYVGIDPGKSGAYAIINEDYAIVSYGLFDKNNSLIALRKTFPDTHTRACLEAVHAMPMQGVTSMFSFGENFGFWKGVLEALDIPYILTPPQTWQKAVLDTMPTPYPKIKGETPTEASRRKAKNTLALKAHITGFARRQFPAREAALSIKRNQGVADALCMALYVKRLDQETLQ
jgi:crossover junction endodeoxyribonuclease RuvC